MKENKTKIIRIVVGTLIPIVYTIIHIPPEVTISQIISAVVVFYVIMYFSIRALNYFKIVQNLEMIYKPFDDIIKKIRYAKAVSQGAEMNDDNKESQEDVFEAIREPSIYKGPLKGTKGFSPFLLLLGLGWFLFLLIFYDVLR